MMGFLDRVNRTKVSAHLLVEVLQMHAAMAPEDRPLFEARAFHIFELLKSKGVRTNRIASLATAINFRLMALARLERDAALRGWSIPRQEPGASLISGEVVKAAAEEPLIEKAEKQAAFDAESFRRRVLRLACGQTCGGRDTVAASMIVMTGSMVPIRYPVAGDRVVIEVSGLGSVELAVS